jgi:hypothetical protein
MSVEPSKIFETQNNKHPNYSSTPLFYLQIIAELALTINTTSLKRLTA